MESTLSALTLEPFTVADAERVLAGEVHPLDGWEGGYSFIDEPELLAQYIGDARNGGDPAPFGPYLVRRTADSAAIGGVNLLGPPDERGAVEFAFGLVPAVRGRGLSRQVVEATLTILRGTGAQIARAEAEIANLSARRALEQAGFVEVARSADSVEYEVRL